jgi:hypothetical protein
METVLEITLNCRLLSEWEFREKHLIVLGFTNVICL